MKRFVCLLISALLLATLAACKPQSDTPVFSTQKANDDFSDLFKSADNGGDALVALTVNKVDQVTDIIEYYAVSDTTYTKVEASVERSFSKQVTDGSLTLYILGTKDNFPNREQLVEGRSYLMKLKPWVHEKGVIWLLSPLESTYLRVFEGEVLVHETATDLNYKKALTLDEFADRYKEYHDEHPLDPAALQKHFSQMLGTLREYDYQSKDLAYTLDDAAIKARLDLAEDLNR